jgi:hypothetical protein
MISNMGVASSLLAVSHRDGAWFRSTGPGNGIGLRVRATGRLELVASRRCRELFQAVQSGTSKAAVNGGKRRDPFEAHYPR